jgi:hypothetical protein
VSSKHKTLSSNLSTAPKINFIPFYDWIILHSMQIVHLVHPFMMNTWVIHLWAIMNNVAVNTGTQNMWVPALNSFGYIPRVVLLSHTVILFSFLGTFLFWAVLGFGRQALYHWSHSPSLLFSFLSNCQIVFHSCCIIYYILINNEGSKFSKSPPYLLACVCVCVCVCV